MISWKSAESKGMTDRLGFEQAKSNQRMEKLAGFQIKILRSALTRYPDAKRVVYSTCSIFPEENEDVVRQVLETNSTYKLVPATKFVNNTWKNFGSKDYGDIGSYCLYAKPNEDFTNGFFVAVFEKLEEGEENQFFNTKIYNFKKHMQSQEKRKRRQQQAMNEDNFGNNFQHRDSQNQDFDPHFDTDNNQIKKEPLDVPEINNSGKKKKKKNKIHENTEDNCSEPGTIQNKKRKSTVANESGKSKKKRKGLSAGLSESVETGDIASEHLDVNIKQEKEKLEVNLEFSEPEKSKKKKKKKDLSDNVENGDTTEHFNINMEAGRDEESVKEDISEPDKSKKKKKKKHLSEDFSENVNKDDNTSTDIDTNIREQQEAFIEEEVLESVKSKKKKKRKHLCEDLSGIVEASDTTCVSEIELDVKKKKNKTRH